MSRRAVAPVIGITLLMGIVLVGAIGVLAVGSMAVDSVKSDASVEQAENSMVQYADSVRNGQSTSLSLPDSGQTEVNSDSTVSIEVGSDEIVNTTMGSVVYEKSGNQRVFEGGAVFSQNQGTATVVSSPPISYEYVQSEQHQTLSIDVVSVDGSVDNLESSSTISQSATKSSITDSPVNDTVSITIHSEYASAWADYFRERTRASVDYDASSNTVTATYPVVTPVTVDNSFTVDGSIGIGGGVSIHSYDSRSAGGTGTVGSEDYAMTNSGDVVATDGFSGSGSGKVNGDLYIDDDFVLGGGGSSVDGDIYATGNVTIATVSSFDGTIVSGGDVIIDQGGATLTEDSKIIARDDVIVKAVSNLGADIRAGGDFVSEDNSGAGGDIRAAEDVRLSGGTYDGVIEIGGNVESTNQVNFAGSFYINGDFHHDGGGSIDGTIHAGRDITSENGHLSYGRSAMLRAGGTISMENVNAPPSKKSENVASPAGLPVSFPSPDGTPPKVNRVLPKIQNAVSNIPQPAEEVQRAQNRYSEASTKSLGGDNADDTIDAGNYRVTSDVSYTGDPSLTFDTTGGNINVLVEGDFDVKNLDAEIDGDGRVNLFVTGNFETTDGAEWTNRDGAGNRLFVYTADKTDETDLGGEFYGVVFSESTADFKGGTNLYGAIVTNGSDVTGGENIYFDEALTAENLSMNSGSVPTNARRTYLHISQTTVEG